MHDPRNTNTISKARHELIANEKRGTMEGLELSDRSIGMDMAIQVMRLIPETAKSELLDKTCRNPVRLGSQRQT